MFTTISPADPSLPITGKIYQWLIEARQRANQQARADRDDLGASKGILLAVLVCITIWTVVLAATLHAL